MGLITGILLAPPRAARRFLDDVSSIAENMGRVADAVEGVEARMDPLDRHVDGLQDSFERSNEELAKIRHAFTPYFAELGRDIAEVRDVAEPLQGAAARVGRAVERLPGPGRRA